MNSVRFESIADLVAHTQVEKFEGVPTARLAPAVMSLFDQAESYTLAKQFEQAYMLYMKGAQLYVEQLSKRADFARTSADNRSKLKNKCLKGMEVMERIKPKLDALYKAKADIAAKAKALRDAELRATQTRVDAHVNTVQQAEMDALERRLLALGAKADELPSSMPITPAAPAAPVYANLSAPPSAVNNAQPPVSAPPAAIAASAAAAAAAAATAAAVTTVPYPALSPSTIGNVFVPTAQVVAPPVVIAPPPGNPPVPVPSAPPMASAPPIASTPPMASAPPMDSIVYSQLPSAPPMTSVAAPAAAPAAAPSTARRALPSMGGANTGMRPMLIDGELLSDFMRLVHGNTVKGIETCGILTGKLVSREGDGDGCFVVTELILPRQKGSQNTCEMIDEDSLFDYQMKNDLMTLGWIHTHPTQSCFLSSVDLHTHLGYQLMLPEAVAIVMSPTDTRSKFGVFTLSDVGVDAIKHCKQKSFHVHSLPDADIYSNALHVKWRSGRPQYKLIDFR